MLSKNNFNEKLMQMNNQKAHFSIRKLTIGAASVLIGITFMGINGQTVNADEMTGNTQPEAMQVSTDKSTDATTTQQNEKLLNQLQIKKIHKFKKQNLVKQRLILLKVKYPQLPTKLKNQLTKM